MLWPESFYANGQCALQKRLGFYVLLLRLEKSA